LIALQQLQQFIASANWIKIKEQCKKLIMKVRLQKRLRVGVAS
jgi:hypothetical protein